MRILLLFLLSVLTASGQAILRSPLSTNTWSSTIVITNGDRTTLSNVFNTANLTNRQIIIQPGRYNIEALVSSTAAPLQSYNWTNVQITAYGAEIFQTLTNESDYWIGSNWVQVTVKGLKLTGTRFASGANVGDSTMFRYKGVGQNVSWIDGHFSTFDQHAFNRHASSGIYTNLTYLNCHFDTFGWRTGVPVLGGDGVCIAPFGPNTRIENCSFYWNHRDIEPQGLNSGQTVRGLLIKNNYHTGFGTISGSGTAEFIYILGDTTPGAYDGISIVGDYFEGVDVSPGNGPAAISIHGVKGLHIQNCYITNVNNGIQFFAGNDSLNWVIQNNTIAGTVARGIHNYDDANAAGHQRYGLIQGNLIEDTQQAGISGCFADTRIANNLFRNNSIGGSQVYAAIQLETPDANDPCTNNVIEGNTFLDTAGSSLTEWGVWLKANVGNTQLGTNFFQNCITNVFDQGVGTDLIHGGGSGATTLPGLTDVADTFGPLATGDLLSHNAANGLWTNGYSFAAHSFSEILFAGAGAASVDSFGGDSTFTFTTIPPTLNAPRGYFTPTPGRTNAAFRVNDTNGPARVEVDTNFNVNLFGSGSGTLALWNSAQTFKMSVTASNVAANKALDLNLGTPSAAQALGWHDSVTVSNIAIVPSPIIYQWGMNSPNRGNSRNLAGNMNSSSVGTNSHIAPSSTDPRMNNYITSGANNSDAGEDNLGTSEMIWSDRDWTAFFDFRLVDTNVVRSWVGISSVSFATQNASDTPSAEYAALRYSHAAEGTWKAVTDNGSGSPTIIDTTIAVSDVYKKLLIVKTSGQILFYIDGVARATNTLTLPSAIEMGPMAGVRALEAAGKNIRLNTIYYQQPLP